MNLVVMIVRWLNFWGDLYMWNVIVLVLGGGWGMCFYLFMGIWVKFVVLLVGKYWLIDILILNCINSDINCVYVLI